MSKRISPKRSSASSNTKQHSPPQTSSTIGTGNTKQQSPPQPSNTIIIGIGITKQQSSPQPSSTIGTGNSKHQSLPQPATTSGTGNTKQQSLPQPTTTVGNGNTKQQSLPQPITTIGTGNTKQQTHPEPSNATGGSSSTSKHYDLIVIGGGSGGLACAKEAADLGRTVAVLDYVDPSPRGTKWGLGGTCVNAGCIPKKLMHQAALLGGAVRDAEKFGWLVPESPTISWEKLSEGIQNYVKSLNWGHRVKLREKNVDYLNAKGFVKDRKTVYAYTKPDKSVQTTLTTDNIVIATGMRPRYPSETEIPGALLYAISSDDIFWMKKPPGKTLCVGASYVSLECAGFLTGFGFDTTVMVRSTPLSRYDKQMSQLVVNAMTEHGTKFYHQCVPTKVEKDVQSGKIKVTWKDSKEQKEGVELFDTVMFAIGRSACTSELGLGEVGVKMDDSGFIIGNVSGDQEQSSVSNIYAIGDVLKDRPELTPVATKAGKLLAKRLFGGSHEQMDYENVPSTVFTPLEYSFVGLSEDEATTKLGSDGIEVYHAFFKPLEYTVPQRHTENCYVKVITDNSPNGRILGMHYTGPNAGEIMQGFAAALRCGMTKEKLTSTIGIHPTCAEEFVKLHITKRSGIDPTVTSC